MQTVQKISIDSLNQSDKLQISLDAINEAKIGLKEMKENFLNKLLVVHLNLIDHKIRQIWFFNSIKKVKLFFYFP